MAETQTSPSSITTPDGRTLVVHQGGAPDGFPIVVHHGSPAAGLVLERESAVAAERGLRVIGFDRPGYGGSDRKRGRTIGDVALDVEAILDALGLDRCITWGGSGGGPHALACAAVLGERCAAAFSISGVAPWGAPGLDWEAGMGADNVAEFVEAAKGEEALVAYLADAPYQFATVTPGDLVASIRSVVSDVDAEVMTEVIAEQWVAVMQYGLTQGPSGWIDDDLAMTSPWGFDVTAPRQGGVPVEIWHGGHDLMVPAAHSRWLADHVPGAVFRFFEDEGHVSLLERHMTVFYDAVARYTF
jgi:pimeloyl-ACP methyl ester carboxylesterase